MIALPLSYQRTGDMNDVVAQLLSFLTTQANAINGDAQGSSPASLTTSLVVNHGLGVTPTTVVATPSINTGAWWINAVGSTSFTLNWITIGSPTWYWRARI